MFFLSNEELKHYGVKGMKWRKHKYKTRQALDDYREYEKLKKQTEYHYNPMYYESSYLEHHGIKGQRWGIRRYQNYDGSYTKAGLDRYQKRNE